jgi:SAM-dependent methyltransferase
MISTFKNYSNYYDIIYKNKNYEEETKYILSILKKHKILNGSLLEFGSGSGKHGCLLASNGYSVHGIEKSAEMIAKAQKSKGFTCQEADISTVKMNRSYDAILALFHVISYQTKNNKLNSVFANASEHLNKDGLFVFDFWYSPAVLSQRPSVRIKKIIDNQVEITRLAEPINYPNENRVNVNYTIYVKDLKTHQIQTFNEVHPMRHLSLPEIDILADVHGFERVKAEEFLTENLPSEDTWGVCVVLRKVR